MPHAEHSRIPEPAAIGGIVEPPTVVIRRPAPCLAADPSPAVIILPNPTATTIWSPSGRYRRGPPNVTIIGDFRPNAGILHIFHARDSRRHVSISPRRLHQHLIAGPIPAIPIV